MNPQTAALLSRHLSMPVAFAVVTKYADGSERSHNTATEAQAKNFAIGERRKIGRELINRDTGKTVRVTSVEVVTL